METFKGVCVIGCDIHGVLQHKEKGRWADKEILDIDRHYGLFGVLAGVRDSQYKAIAADRGFPSDFEVVYDKQYNNPYHPSPLSTAGECFDTQIKGIWMGDHSFTHMTLEEIQRYDWKSIIDDVWLPESIKDMLLYCSNLKQWRIVIGFDS